MSSKRKFVAIATALVACAGALWLGVDALRPDAGGVLQQVPVRLENLIVSVEDPQARFRFEWMRLRDPATGQIPPGIRARELRFARTLPTREALAAGKNGMQPFSWTPRGPVNLGGRTRALAIDASNEEVLLAGGVSGGMWRSPDGGLTWVQTTGPDQHPSVTCLTQDTRPGKTNVWYYGSGELIGNSASAGQFAFYTGRGVYKSTDGGRSWQLTGLRDETPRFDNVAEIVFNVAVDPSNTTEDEVYAAVYGVIYRSVDGGSSWRPVLSPSSGGSFSPYTDVAVTRTGVVYATMSSQGATAGLWRSPDGVNWTNITPPGWPAVYGRTVIGPAPSNPDVVFFLAATPGTGATGASLWKYTYVSGNGAGTGGTWQNRTENIPTDADFPDNFNQEGLDVGGFDPQGGYNLLVRVRPDDENVVFIGGTNLYRSTDGFASKTNIAWIGGYHPVSFVYPNHHPDLHALTFYPSNPRRALSGSDGGVHRTANIMERFAPDTPVRWASLNSGYLTTQFYSVAIDNATPGDQTIIGGMQDNGTFFTNEMTGKEPWVGDLLGGDGAFTDIADGRRFYYVSAQEAQIYRLKLTAGGIIEEFARVDPPKSEFGGALFITPFMLDPANQDRMFLGGGDRVWRNNNLAAIPRGNSSPTLRNWDVLTQTGGTGATISAVAPAAVPSGAGLTTRLYYASFRSSGNNVFESRVLRIDNAHTGDPAPTDITGPNFPAGAYVSSIGIDPNDPDRLMVVFSNYGVRSLFFSADGGATWSHVGGNLEENPDGSGSGPSTRWAEILPRSDGTIYFVGTSTGLYSTTRLDGAATVWVREGEATIGNVVVDMIDARPVDGFVAIGTHGTGVYSTIVPAQIGVGRASEDVPEHFVLSPAYPNPFGASTQITLSLAQGQHVRADAFDAVGRKVATLFDGFVPAGIRHDLRFEAADRASGRYFIHVEGETFRATRQVVLAK